MATARFRLAVRLVGAATEVLHDGSELVLPGVRMQTHKRQGRQTEDVANGCFFRWAIRDANRTLSFDAVIVAAASAATIAAEDRLCDSSCARGSSVVGASYLMRVIAS